MKQKIFTLIMMLALVIVAGSAFAQTPQLPNVGDEETYTVTGITNGDTYSFYVTASTVTVNPAGSEIAAGLTTYAYTTGSQTGTKAGIINPSVGITWYMGNSSDTYHLWIVTTRATCSNYRYVTITPQNELNFLIVALNSGTDADDGYNGTDIVTDPGEDPVCADPYDFEYDEEDAAPSNGSTFIYFRIERVDGVTANAWRFDLGVTLGGTGLVAADIEFSASGTGSWAAQADLNDIPVAAGSNIYYARANVASLTAADRIVEGTISDMLELTTDNVELAANNGDNVDNLTLSATPPAGNFGL